jgi:23S rRNA (uracil1939-C5)-methyltransferase
MREIEGIIERIGGHGDGIMATDIGRLYVPFTVPGDRVTARIGKAKGDGFAATLHDVSLPGPDRVDPVCEHFHDCGGCTQQHWRDAAYLMWKRDQVVQALARRDLIDIPVADIVAVPPRERRRADLVARRVGRGALIGLHEAGGKRIVDMRTCHVLDPRLVALLPALREMLADLLVPGGEADVLLTLTEGGIDCTLGRLPKPTGATRLALTAFAERHGLARIALLDPADAVVTRHAPAVRFAGVPVTIPPGGFLQASPAAEAAMAREVVAALAGAKRIVDLFAGAGTFSFALAGQAVVHAIDSDQALTDALILGANRAVLGGRVGAETRDLFRRPLTPAELKKYDGAVFDPPRAGAREQAEQLARSKVPVVVGVSCNPSSFARDARLLVDGGYTLEKVVPIDQFRWTAHVEVVGIFRRN